MRKALKHQNRVAPGTPEIQSVEDSEVLNARSPQRLPPVNTPSSDRVCTDGPDPEFWQWSTSDSDKAKLLALFQMLDVDHNFGITTTELRHLLTNLGENVSDHLVNDMMTVVDANVDKHIDLEEFLGVMTGATKMADVEHSPARFDKANLLDKDGRRRLQEKLSRVANVRAYSNEEMRQMFNDMDADGGNTLDKYELMELADHV